MLRKAAQSFRRTAIAVLATALALGTVLGTGTLTATAEQDEFVVGSARSDAKILRVGPSAARLGLAPSVGLAMTDFLGTQGRGESRLFDYAALEGTFEDNLPEEWFETTSPVRVVSTDEGAADGESVQRGPFRQEARATDTPSGWAVTAVEAVSVPGAINIGAGWAMSFAHVTEHNGEPVREAGGAVSINRVDLGDGAVVLDGLRWDVLQRTTRDDSAEPHMEGRFVVGSAHIGGETHQGPITGTELRQLTDPINEALAPTGLTIRMPQLRTDAGVARLTPLAVSIIDSDAGREVLGPLLGELQPVREAIFDPLLEACEDCSAGVLVADVLVGVLSGAGRMDIELGGTFGYTEGERFENPFAFDAPPLGDVDLPGAPAAGVPADTPRAPGSPGTPGTPGTPGVEDAPAAGETGTGTAAGPLPTQPATSGWSASPASMAVATGLFGLGLAVAFGLAEYRQLRARRIGLA